ncbi:MAG: CfrBI family restriction endonuclease [Calditrichaeota bacterium]|nr:MAG: CfrBI family restriction endonuclease [Calditrichota bacterium]
MTLTEQVTKRIIRKLIKGEDYRIEIVTLINAQFLQYVIEFFKQVAEAKLKNQNITVDWYKKEMLSLDLSPEEIAINSGLNKKTITNMYNSGTKEIVINASYEHYDTLYKAIEDLTQVEDLNLSLSIKFNKVSIELDINESLIVINTLAVKRAALRGGLWSTAGKQAEGPLMLTLCKLFKVPKENYTEKLKSKKVKKGSVNREVDFFLNTEKDVFKCEVKLMGKGNPESADAVIARDSKVFVADKLSDQNKAQLDELGVEWVELREINGFKKFKTVLDNLEIPNSDFCENLELELDRILA